MSIRSPSFWAFLAVATCALAPCACSAGGGDEPVGAGGAAGTAGAAGSAGLSGTDGGAGAPGDAPSGFDALTESQAGPPVVPEVFGHSSTVLYRLDPDTKAVTVVGSFKGCTSVIDIALDKDSKLFGTTFDGLYSIDKTTAACKLVAKGSYPNSLSFVPKGTVDPDAEALVGYLEAKYVRIDTTNGNLTTIGGLTGGYSSSGDIVSVKGGATYLTVKGLGCEDCIVEVNPTTGDLVMNWGKVGYKSVFGLAFWAGKAYGFSDGGDLFEVTIDANGVKTSPIPIPNKPGNLSFWGAGSTTSAPVLPPK